MHIPLAPFVALLSIFCTQLVLAQDTTAVNPAERSNTKVIINGDKNPAQTVKENKDDSLAKAQSSTTAGTGGDSIGGQTPSQRTDLQRRRVSYNFATFGFGPATMKNMGTNELAYSFFAGRLWEVNPYAAVKANFEVTSDFSHAVAGMLDLGSNFYILNTDVAPYIGGDLGFGLGRNADGKTPYGFVLGGAIGIVLFRTSTVQMSVEGKAQVLFDTHNKSYPDIYTVRLGVMF